MKLKASYKINPVTGEILEELEQVEIYPAKHFITQEDRLRKALSDIEEELDEQLKVFKNMTRNTWKRSGWSSARASTWK